MTMKCWARGPGRRFSHAYVPADSYRKVNKFLPPNRVSYHNRVRTNLLKRAPLLYIIDIAAYIYTYGRVRTARVSSY